ncbi:MAG: VCBS repeat-containing protein [Myxococcales bacterium]|nr:VCBS repeat-containing protein [Myxococcales bacterium]
MNRPLLFAFTALTACGASSGGGRGVPTSDGGIAQDLSFALGAPDLAGMPPGGPCDDQHPCPMGRRCYLGGCIPDNGTCQSDDECQNDTYCDCTLGGGGDAGACIGGVCVPYGNGPRGAFDPDCSGGGFAVSDFKPPVVSCHWVGQGSGSALLMTPVVADLDGDGKAEIIMATYDGPGSMIAVHHDCTPYFSKPAAGVTRCSQLAVADLDGDKVPEIIGLSATRVVVFDNQGNKLASSPTAYITDNQGDDCTGPAIADADGDGIPEILVAAQVLHYKKGQPQLEVLWTKKPSSGTTAHWGTLSLFADLDGDGKAEVVTGLKVFDGLTGGQDPHRLRSALHRRCLSPDRRFQRRQEARYPAGAIAVRPAGRFGDRLRRQQGDLRPLQGRGRRLRRSRHRR